MANLAAVANTVSHDEVGLLAYSGSVMEQIELDLNGNLIRRVPMTDVDGANDGAAFTSDGNFHRKDRHSDRLMRLKTTTTDWLDAGSGPIDLQRFARPDSSRP